MKQSTKTLLLVAGLAVLLLAATLGYRALTAGYDAAPLQSATEPSAPQESPQSTEAPVSTPMPAPDFTVYTESGETVRLSDFLGRPVVINFWASWCGPCKSELPAFDAAYAAYGDRVEFLMINLTDGQRETVEGVREFMRQGGYTFPVYYDTAYDAATTYGTYSIPVTVLVNAEGNLVGGQVGPVSEAALMSALEVLAAQ